jgi:hypothetical protein
MAAFCAKAVVLAVVLLVSSTQLAMGARRRMELYRPNPADMLSYHNGDVLHGDIPVSVLWYSGAEVDRLRFPPLAHIGAPGSLAVRCAMVEHH